MTRAVHEMNRYARQQLIEGWDQKKLSKARVAIVGAGTLGKEIAIPLAALGIGYLRIIGTENDEGVLDAPPKKQSGAKSLEEMLTKLNDDISIKSVEAKLVNAAGAYLLNGVDCIVEATNDPRSKAVALAYGEMQKIPVICAATMPHYGRFLLNYKQEPELQMLQPEFERIVQDPFVSAVVGAQVSEEVKRIFMHDKEEWLQHQFYYNALSPDRFVPKEGATPELPYEFRDAKVLMIGAGALGNFAGKMLAQMRPARIDVMDPDDVEPTNLNRQVLYYDSVGQPKALALAHKLTAISGNKTKVSGIVEKFGEDTALPTKYDVIFDCVDSDIARKVINEFATSKKIPLVSGGTDYKGGRCIVYVPGKTSCLCQVNIGEKAAAEDERNRHSCIYAPNPSVITTNQVIGSLMANEARTIFAPESYGEPVNGVIKLTNHEYRIGLNKISKLCNCHKGGEKS